MKDVQLHIITRGNKWALYLAGGKRAIAVVDNPEMSLYFHDKTGQVVNTITIK